MDLLSYSSGFGNSTHHVMFVPKYRHTIFRDARVRQRCSELFREVEERYKDQYGLKIRELGIDEDHVHLLIEMGPNCSIATAVKLLKGFSAYKLFKEFPYLRSRYFWGGHLWSPSYFFRSVGPATLEVMQNYVRNQGQPIPSTSSTKQTKLTDFMAS